MYSVGVIGLKYMFMRRINYVVDIKIGMDNEKQAVINNSMNTNQQRGA